MADAGFFRFEDFKKRNLKELKKAEILLNGYLEESGTPNFKKKIKETLNEVKEEIKKIEDKLESFLRKEVNFYIKKGFEDEKISKLRKSDIEGGDLYVYGGKEFDLDELKDFIKSRIILNIQRGKMAFLPEKLKNEISSLSILRGSGAYIKEIADFEEEFIDKPKELDEEIKKVSKKKEKPIRIERMAMDSLKPEKIDTKKIESEVKKLMEEPSSKDEFMINLENRLKKMSPEEQEIEISRLLKELEE